MTLWLSLSSTLNSAINDDCKKQYYAKKNEFHGNFISMRFGFIGNLDSKFT